MEFAIGVVMTTGRGEAGSGGWGRGAASGAKLLELSLELVRDGGVLADDVGGLLRIMCEVVELSGGRVILYFTIGGDIAMAALAEGDAAGAAPDAGETAIAWCADVDPRMGAEGEVLG